MTETEETKKTGNVNSLDDVVDERMAHLKMEIGNAYTQEQQKVAGEILIEIKNIGEHLSASIIQPFRYAKAKEQLGKLYKKNPNQHPLIDYLAEIMLQQTDVYQSYISLSNQCNGGQNGNGKKFK